MYMEAKKHPSYWVPFSKKGTKKVKSVLRTKTNVETKFPNYEDYKGDFKSLVSKTDYFVSEVPFTSEIHFGGLCPRVSQGLSLRYFS